MTVMFLVILLLHLLTDVLRRILAVDAKRRVTTPLLTMVIYVNHFNHIIVDCCCCCAAVGDGGPGVLLTNAVQIKSESNQIKNAAFNAHNNMFKIVLKMHVYNLEAAGYHGELESVTSFSLPPVKDTIYNLQQRSHSLTLSSEDSNLIRKNFLYRMLYKDIY